MKKMILLVFIFATMYTQATRWYVTQNGAGTLSGTSWANAKAGTSLVSLMSSISAYDTVWVATGIYYTCIATIPQPSDYLISFSLRDSAAMYGGFSGTETSVTQRNIIANPSILSGNVGVDGYQTNNARHVVTMARNCTIDGFTIQDGYSDANDRNMFSSGAGLWIYNIGNDSIDNTNHTIKIRGPSLTSVNVVNCTFINNVASGTGGAVSIYSVGRNILNATFSKCKFMKNQSSSGGGAIYATSTKFKSVDPSLTNLTPDSVHGNLTLRINNCIFDSNTATSFGGGGAIYLDANLMLSNAKPAIKTFIDSSTFTNNSASGAGVIGIEMSMSIYKGYFDSLCITNSNFSNNKSTYNNGGVIGLSGGGDTSSLIKYFFYNCNFSNNYSSTSAGVFYNGIAGASQGIIRKCTFFNNVGDVSCLSFEVGHISQYPQLYKSSFIIDSCLFKYNGSYTSVIGLLFWNPSDTLKISNSIISNNAVSFQHVYLHTRNPIKFTNCNIDSNIFPVGASGKSVVFIDPNLDQLYIPFGKGKPYTSFDNCVFRKNINQNNYTNGSGAILYNTPNNGDTVYSYINNCVFVGNLGSVGGAVSIDATSNQGSVRLFIDNTILSGNEAKGSGGAIAAINGSTFRNTRSEILLRNSLISGNRAVYDGAGLSISNDTKLMMYNCTVASNYASLYGNGYGAGLSYGGTGFARTDTSKICNSIFWNNIVNGKGHKEIMVQNVNYTISNSIIEGINIYIQNANQNVLTYDPLFVNPMSVLSAPTSGGDYHLLFCSPAVNRGDNITVATPTDLDNTARIKQTIVDLGAYESNYINYMNPLPVAYSSYQKACELTPYQLSSNTISGATYSWIGPNGFTSNLQNPLVIPPDHIANVDSTVVYTLTVTYSSGCTLSDTVAVVVKASPKVNIIENDTFICGTNYSVTLHGNYILAQGAGSLAWMKDSISGNILSTYLNYVALGISSHKYYLRIQDMINGCSAIDSVNISIGNKPTAPIVSGNKSVCEGDSLKLNIIPLSGFNYKWSGPNSFLSNTQNLQIPNTTTLMSGNYSVYGIKMPVISSCDTISAATVTVVVNAKPITLSITGNTIVNAGTSQNYSVTNTSGSVYRWSVLNGTQTSGTTTNAIAILWSSTSGAGSVKVLETSNSGCKGDTVTKNISLNSIIPDSLTLSKDTLYFTPSGGLQNVNVISNKSWAVSNTASWLTINPMSGLNNGTLNVTAQPNSSGSIRFMNVSVTAGIVTRNLFLFQDKSTGINEVNLSEKIQVYPNPSNGILLINNASEENLHVKIIDMNGKLIDKFLMNAKTEKQLKYEKLADGIYLMQMSSDNLTIQRRLIIIK